jgi:hypothetical protein
MLSDKLSPNNEGRYAECRYAECPGVLCRCAYYEYFIIVYGMTG